MRRSVPRHIAILHESRAGAMRAAPTTSEAALWELLRGSRLGVAFRRQVAIGRAIVDFAAPSVGLIVEVDGGYHERRARADERRDRGLLRLGWRVLGVRASDVLERPSAVAALIRGALES